jgi:hypothetical protein
VSVLDSDFGGEGQVKGCAAGRVVGSPKAAAMRFDDRPADPKSHARAAPLGGKEGIKDIVLLLGWQPLDSIGVNGHLLL